MNFIDLKTKSGKKTGEIAFYCRILKVSRQGFYKYLKSLDKPWKYELLAAEIIRIINEDECNDTYGYVRIHQALKLKEIQNIPSERTIYCIMQKLGLVHKVKHKPNGITKEDEEARKSDDLIKRDFMAEALHQKCVTDITEIKTADGKLYVSAIEDCFDNAVIGLSMANNMRAELCVNTLRNAMISYPSLRGAIIHSDRGSQYTSHDYRRAVKVYGIKQSMNSPAGKCHDNAKCESLWGRFKEELLYNRYDTKKMSMSAVKSLVCRYFMSYWNNRRICSANGGLPPMFKRKQYYENLVKKVA